VRTLSRAVPLLLAGLLLAGCGGADEPGVDEPTEPDPGLDEPDADDPDEAADGPDEDPDDLDALAEQVAADAAAEEGVDVEAVRIVTAEHVTWPDGALGCPEDDGMYTQALVEGYRIVVEVDGQEHHYHGGAGQGPFRCDDPQEPAER
jgi:hypothetical protein